jgi:hypothetical protein
VPPYRTAPWTREELDGHRLVVLVDLEFAGRTLRSATETIAVTSSTSATRSYAGTLDSVEYSRELDLFSENGKPGTMAVSGFFGADVPELYAQGYRLEGCCAQVSQVRVPHGSTAPADTYEQRRVLMTGAVRDGSYSEAMQGGAQTYLELTIERPFWYNARTIGREKVTRDTWSGRYLNDDDLRRSYPLLLGYPGIDVYDPDGCMPAFDWVWVRRQELFRVAAVGTGDIEATTAKVCAASTEPVMRTVNVTKTYTNAGSVIPAVDRQGTLVACVDFAQHSYESGATALPTEFRPDVDDDADAIFVGLNESTGGGIMRDGRVVRDAGDVILWLLEQSGAVVDYGRAVAARPALAKFKIDGAIVAKVSPIELLVGEFFPLLPVSIACGEDGLYPVVWRGEVHAADAPYKVDSEIDVTVAFADHVDTDATRILNHFSLDYGYNVRTDSYTYQARMGPTAIASTEQATARLVSTETASTYERILLYARDTGLDGVGITVTLTDTGTLDTVDNLTTRTVTVTFDSAALDPGTTIAADINAKSSLIEARAAGNTNSWLGTTTPSVTTKLGDFGTLAHPSCAASYDYMRKMDGGAPGSGIRREELSSEWIYDAQTAIAILEWRALAFGLPHRRVSFTAPEIYAYLDDIGAPIVINHPALGLYDAVGTIEAFEHYADRGLVGVRVVFTDTPAMRQGRAAS